MSLSLLFSSSIIRSSAWSFGHSDPDPSSVFWMTAEIEILNVWTCIFCMQSPTKNAHKLTSEFKGWIVYDMQRLKSEGAKHFHVNFASHFSLSYSWILIKEMDRSWHAEMNLMHFVMSCEIKQNSTNISIQLSIRNK